MQPIEIVQPIVTAHVEESQPLAPILDGLLTTFLQEFMTVAEVAQRLGVCRSTVYQLCERGELLGGHAKPATDGHLKTGHQ
jgi:hypothetical protein